MDGELGVLYQGGEQVGGIYDWEIKISSNSTIRDAWWEYKIDKEITAKSYWLTDTPVGNCFEVKLYKVQRGQLVLIQTEMVEIGLPDKTLDRRFRIPLEIVLCSIF